MKKNVSLKITSAQYEEKLQPKGESFVRELELEDSIEILTEGTMYSKNNATYIMYEESEKMGTDNMKTLLKLTDKSEESADTEEDLLAKPGRKALLIRRYTKDDDDMNMLLQQGVKNITRYKLPQLASMDIELYTNKLEDNLDEEGYGTISVDYKIKFDTVFTRRNLLEIEVRPA